MVLITKTKIVAEYRFLRYNKFMIYNQWVIKYFFPVRLKALRESKGKHQEHIAQKLKVNHRTISHWEKGRAEPSLSLLTDLAWELQVDVCFLLCQDYETQKTLQLAVMLNNDEIVKENEIAFDANRIIYFDGNHIINKLQKVVISVPYNDGYKKDGDKLYDEVRTIYYECLKRVGRREAYTPEMLSLRKYILYQYAKQDCIDILEIFNDKYK